MHVCTYLLRICTTNFSLRFTYFHSYAVIVVAPASTALTVWEPDQTEMIQIIIVQGTVFLPITITYVTTSNTATGRLHIVIKWWL